MRTRAPLIAVVVLLCINLLAACSGPERERDVQSTPGATATAAATSTVPAGATSTGMPGAVDGTATVKSGVALTATAGSTATVASTATIPPPTATMIPTATPSPTSTIEPTPSPTPLVRPVDQDIDLPDVSATYDLVVDVLDVDTGAVHAFETITVVANGAELPSELFLQVVPAMYGYFTLESLAVNGNPVSPTVLNDGFTLVLDLSSISGGTVVIDVVFALLIGRESSGWGVVSLDAGILRLGNWFPIISDDHGPSETLDPSYTAVATFDVIVTVPSDTVVAHTGDMVDSIVLEDGSIEFTFHAEQVRDFAMTASRDYRSIVATSANGVQVEVYSVSATAGQEAIMLQTAIDALDLLHGLIGPYPYTTLRIVDAGPTLPGGVEFPGLIYVNPAYQPLDRLLYHEIAHQWLYGIIGTRTLIDGWVDEGGAEFFERGLPTGFVERAPVPDGGFLYPLDSSSVELPLEPRDAWYRAIYEQGAHFYMAVLEQMGNDPFWASMRELYAQFAFGIATAWDVLLNWQMHSPEDLRPLFRETFRYTWIDQLPEPGGVD